MNILRTLFTVVIIAIIGCGEQTPQFMVEQSTEKQQERLALIDRLSTEDVFPKVTFADNGPLIFVGSAFDGLDAATKLAYVKEIHAYGFNEKKGLFPARLRDLKTGNTVGEYHPDTGLVLE